MNDKKEYKEMQEMAQYVFENGKVEEQTIFKLGDSNKESYVVRLDDEKYYLTKTDGEWSYFFHGGNGYDKQKETPRPKRRNDDIYEVDFMLLSASIVACIIGAIMLFAWGCGL